MINLGNMPPKTKWPSGLHSMKKEPHTMSHTKKFYIKQDQRLGLLEPVLAFFFMSHPTFAQSISYSMHKDIFHPL